MKLLTLVRHAKSSWDYAELNDFERPLNERGRRDAPIMAERARRMLGHPDRLVSSPALRAITTAHVFAEAFGMPRDEIELQPRIYEAAPDALLRIVRELADSDDHVMLFGHNPGFSELARLLAQCGFDEMPTCALVQLEINVSSWKDATPGCGLLRQYSYPKQ
ncbi:MAG TPA: histidine phosphatase family protein [Solimonas sp.]|nr:histidine phosphatase family protein [Solimonas sp.]